MEKHVENWIQENGMRFDFIRVSDTIIETVSTYTLNGVEVCDYDFRMVYPDFSIVLSGIGTGFYFQQGCKRGSSSKVGVRKLYQSSKGRYFIESGKREYLNKFTRPIQAIDGSVLL